MLPKEAQQFEHWTVPFDTDPDYPEALADAVVAYRAAWRAKMDAVNGCIEANAEPKELVDQPKVVRGIVRVSGPFTVEAVQPPEISLGVAETAIDGEPEELETGFERDGTGEVAAQNAEAYLDQMLRLLRVDGVRFTGNRQMEFDSSRADYRAFGSLSTPKAAGIPRTGATRMLRGRPPCAWLSARNMGR